MLSILVWGCASRGALQQDPPPVQAAGSGMAWVLFILIPMFFLLAALLSVCWMVMVRQRKALLVAEVNLHQQEIRSATLVFQLREASRKYKALLEGNTVSPGRGNKHSGASRPEDNDDMNPG
ncbi:hypothetical protein [Chitinophaga qingshengii]|uniref:LapA family protein n=1 Tax=Chitinophaga qingshengii TaxID=1569794 RepID=A0ABR7TJS1_9BACT|nr:hypothetical protein [Chitinophaga qingshengii]MBC9929304.1 hypothetical protein [Chitinophaga qingshengii]